METAEFCKNCTRKGNTTSPVTSTMNICSFNMMDAAVRDSLEQNGKEGTAGTAVVKFFDGRVRGNGLSDDMPPNTTLEDINSCEKPVVVGREGFLNLQRVRECGAYMGAVARLEALPKD